MGCDIHSVAEVKWSSDGWETVQEALWEHPYYRPDEPTSYHNVPYHNKPFYDRHYTLFAYLAGVRNYKGISPLVPPRGIPEDASVPWRTYCESWDLHSHTWYTWDELRLAKTKDLGVMQAIDDALKPLAYIATKFPIRYEIAFDN